MPNYERVLNTKENFRACNQGICAKDQTMATYKQYKNALTYFYPKRKVLEDGRSTVPLDISELCIYSVHFNITINKYNLSYYT